MVNESKKLVNAIRSIRLSPQIESLLFGLLSVGSFILLWWFLVDVVRLGSPTTIASPVDVTARFFDLMRVRFAGLTLPGHLGASIYRWGIGVGFAVLIGVPLGIFMAWYKSLDAAVSPIFEVLRNIPPLAWIPLAILWFGTGLVSQSAMVFVGAFPPCVINSYRAVQSIDPMLFWAARTLGARPLRQLLEIALPTGLPTILAGIQIAFGNGWMALVGAELVAAPSGIGYLIIRGQENLQPDVIFVGMITIGMMGLLLDGLLRIVGDSIIRWR
jgi:ABC-type nitrate/sulfonate/bicarbonate transport system permease component